MRDDDGEDGKRDGMRRAEEHADDHWKLCMLLSAKAVAERKPFLDSEDIVRWCYEHHPNATTHEKRAIGGIMTSGAKLGYFIKTDRFNKSTWRPCHRRDMRMWQSLIYRGPAVPKLRRQKPIDPRQFKMDF
jgi:hypothetical protein